jgi:hypothetical protein
MDGLVLCEAGARPGACIMPPLARRGAIVGVEADGGNPYCCCGCPRGVGMGGTSDAGDGPGSAVYGRPLDGKKGERAASIVAGLVPLPELKARDGDLAVKILRFLGYVALWASALGGVLEGACWAGNGCAVMPIGLAPNCVAVPTLGDSAVASLRRRRFECPLASDSAGFNIECTFRSLDGPDDLQSSPDGAA